MCITIKKPLNPFAQEWAPPPKTPFYPLPPPPPPPHAAVHTAAAAPQKLTYPLYFQGFIPYGAPCIRPQPHFLQETAPPPPPPPPAAATQNLKRKISQPRMRICLGSFSGGDESTPRRLPEWRSRKSAGVRAAVAAPSPPRRSAPCRTTLMIKNLPNQLRRDFMLEFLDSICKAHSLEYDFFYLPMDFCKLNNLGYAFVNLTSTRGALRLKEVVQDYEWGSVATENGTFISKKICDVKWATTQGKEGQMKRFSNSIFACDNVEFLPVVFDPPRNGSNREAARPVTVGALRRIFCESSQ